MVDRALDGLLADPATGDLTGIVDWSDAILGDPARDFVPLVVWRGWAFAEEVLRSYPGPVDSEFRERLLYSARVLALLWPGEMPGQAADLIRRTLWVRNAFGHEGSSG